MIGPHRAGEGMIFSIAERLRRLTAQMRIHSETNRVARNFNPEMAPGVGCAPAKNDQRIKLLEAATALERVAVKRFEHLCQAALLEHTPGIFAHRLALRLC